MSQIMVATLLIFLIIVLFVPVSILVQTDIEGEEVKEALNLAVKALPNNIMISYSNTKALAEGCVSPSIEIDKSRLLQEFSEIYKSNTSIQNEPIKILVFYDRFIVTDYLNRWSVPFFFVYEHEKELYYLNTKENIAYYYDLSNNKKNVTINSIYLSEEQKNQVIIDHINRVVSQYAQTEFALSFADSGAKNGINHNNSSYFNVLDELTFFAIYVGKRNLEIWGDRVCFHNYCVSGFTMEK